MAESLIELPVRGFLDDLASSAPAPGGGGVAALAGALGAALLSMVGNLTVGRAAYAGVQGQMAELIAHSEQLRARLAGLIQTDYVAFMQLSRSMKMPKDSDAARGERHAAVQEALQGATEVPMGIAEACAEVMEMCRPVAEIGNVHAVSDAGVAVLMAEAGLRSAALNVLINLSSIEDAGFTGATRSRLDALLAGCGERCDAVYDYVVSRL